MIEPLESLADLQKGIIVPRERMEQVLAEFDWTWEQLARGEFPAAIAAQGKSREERLQILQLGIICEDPLLWCQAFLREPTDPNHKDPYQFFDYQLDSLRCSSSVVHQDGAEVGKTREIVAWTLWKNFTCPNGSGLIAAPLQIHLDEIIDAKLEQMHSYNPMLGKSITRHKKQPYTQFKFSNEFKEDFRPAGFDGNAFRGVHADTFGVIDEAAKLKNKPQWTEFWRSLKPGATCRAYSVPDGDRESGYFQLTMRAAGKTDAGEKELNGYNFRLFRWGKDLMPAPFWTPERKRFFVEQYGGEDSPGYRHNVLGEHGDPENTVFPWHQFRLCVKEIPEYRALKVLVDSSRGEVIVEGYTCRYQLGDDGPLADKALLLDEVFTPGLFFASTEDGDSPFRQLIRSFFAAVPGMTRGGGDFGFSPDPTELTVWNVIGRRRRLVARLQLKQVTYDQQCEGLDALDDVYGCTTWGTDFGNAGSAVAHVLQGEQYEHKGYEHRLRGFMFQSTTENVDEDGEPLVDAKTGKPSKITMKELATDLISRKVQRQELEIPPDQDLIMAYTNHTCRIGERQRIYNKENDHLIDSGRVAELAAVLGVEVEDIFV